LCYAGHQFGNWAGQLGDGRAINLTEVVHEDKTYTLQLKVLGPPYSRTADGFAVLRSSIREYLCAEACIIWEFYDTFAANAFCDPVLRDVLYNGNPAYEKVLLCVEWRHRLFVLEVSKYWLLQNDLVNLKLLTDFTIKTPFPAITSEGAEISLRFCRSC
jgi:uncharacterized protein YdiU (UPF0061 family)